MFFRICATKGEKCSKFTQKGAKITPNFLSDSKKLQKHNKKMKMKKVCLDCAGVYRSHVRPARKLHFLKMLPLIFCCVSQGSFFMDLLGAAAAKASTNNQKRVRE